MVFGLERDTISKQNLKQLEDMLVILSWPSFALLALAKEIKTL